MTNSLYYLADYCAPPAADRFKSTNAAELREIRDEYAGAPDPAWDEACTDAYLLYQATSKLAHDMAADGVPILMARDEDSLYFATTVEVWRVYGPCGARKWITADSADIARTRAESWVAEGDWGEVATVDSFVEPYNGIDGDYAFTTDGWRREFFTVQIPRG